MPRNRRVSVAAAGILATLALVQLAPARAATMNVTVADNLFQPPTVTITQGDTVVWTQPGSRVHNVTADDGSFSSGNLAAGGTFPRAFDAPGTFGYYCSIHGAAGGIGMSGVVVVQAATTTTTTIAPATTTTAATTTTTATGAATTTSPATTPTTRADTTTTTPRARVLSDSGAARVSGPAPAAIARTGPSIASLVSMALALILAGAVLVRRARPVSRDDAGAA